MLQLITLFLFCINFLAEAKQLTPNSNFSPTFSKSKLIDARIVDGDEVKPPHYYNFQVAIFIDMPHMQEEGFCAGSLITRRYVLSAGHCIAGANKVEIVFGAHNINKTESSQIRMTSNKFRFHEDIVIFFGLNDLVLIELPEAVPLSDEIGLAKLPSLNDIEGNLEGEKATFVGWGYTSDDAGELSDVLRRTNTEVIGNEECLESFFVIQPHHICMDCRKHRCPCNGDAGGALIHNGKLIGIVSFGSAMGCSDPLPAVAQRISNFVEWIITNTDIEAN